MMSVHECILLVGDTKRHMQSALSKAMHGTPVVTVNNHFEAVAELVANSYTALIAPIEPVERRAEAAFGVTRELIGEGRVIAYCDAGAEPLARQLAERTVDDYVISPPSPHELKRIFEAPVQREIAVAPTHDDESHETPATSLDASIAHLQQIEQTLNKLTGDPAMSVADMALHLGHLLPPDVRLWVVDPSQETTPAVPEPSAVQLINEKAELRLAAPQHDQASAEQLLARVGGIMQIALGINERFSRMQRLAITDDLTGVHNSRYFRHFLDKIIEKARTRRFTVTLLLFDIDDFKSYNDRYGHAVGDDILKQTAAVMRRCCREHDVVARIGGDEFAVIFWEKEPPRQPRNPTSALPSRSPQTPMQVLERFRRQIASKDFSGLGPAGKGTLTISGALAVYPYDANSADQLIKVADEALMFEAKKGGKNRVALVGKPEAR